MNTQTPTHPTKKLATKTPDHASLFEAADHVATAETPVEIKECDEHGVVKFSVPLKSLGLKANRTDALKTCKAGFAADVLGEALVRGSLNQFSILMEYKQDYERFCRQFLHKHFAVETDDAKAYFRFHISLLSRIFNDVMHDAVSDGCDKKPDASGDESIYSILNTTAGAKKVDGSALDMITGLFKEEGWCFEQTRGKDEQSIRFSTSFSRENGSFISTGALNMTAQRFLFRSMLPVSVPEDRRMAVAEYLTRANYGTIIGGFEMDLRDGEVAFKTSLCFKDAQLTQALIKHLVCFNFSTMSRYLPGFFKVIYANAEPLATVTEIES